MRAQEKNIRGFNLLELLVVIVIISIISAAAYPNFSSWRKEREVRTAATKIKNLFTNINSQVQSGSFAFAQVEVTNEFDPSLPDPLFSPRNCENLPSVTDASTASSGQAASTQAARRHWAGDRGWMRGVPSSTDASAASSGQLAGPQATWRRYAVVDREWMDECEAWLAAPCMYSLKLNYDFIQV